MMSIMKPKPPFVACTNNVGDHQVRDADDAVLYSGRGDQPDTYYISYMVLDWYRNKYPEPKWWKTDRYYVKRSDGFTLKVTIESLSTSESFCTREQGDRFRTNLAELLNTHPFGQEDYS